MLQNGVNFINDCFDKGRVHRQRLWKDFGANTTGVWGDMMFRNGQPPYDGRVGAALTFTPKVSTKNQSIYFPDIQATEKRYLFDVTLWFDQSTGSSILGPENIEVFDLLGFYPLINGGDTETQTFINTESLPRYTSGEGVYMALINHIAPQTGIASATISYQNHLDQTKTLSFSINQQISLIEQGNFCASPTTTSVQTPSMYMMRADGDLGVKSVNSIKIDSECGGFYCLYLVKPIAFLGIQGGNQLLGKNQTKQYPMLKTNSFNLPIIEDGASLSFAIGRTGGGGVQRKIFGNFTFIWG